MNATHDVVVIGGGTAGTVAAIQAGRAGARTLLIEKSGILGGTMVTSAVAYPASFHAHGTQVIGGIGWEICCRARAEVGEPAPDPATMRGQGGGRLHFDVNPAVLAAVAEEMVLTAGVEMLLHTMPASVQTKGTEWELEVCTKTGLRNVRTDILVDCTGDANVVELAGFAVNRNPELQAATLVVRVSGYDADTLDYEAIQKAFEHEVSVGRMKRTDPGWDRGRIDFFLKSYGGNRIHVAGVDARSSEGKTETEIEARRAMLRLLRFCRRQPGMEHFTIDYCAIECGIRETATIVGKKTITIQDYASGRLWEDAVCYSFYPVDIHRTDWLDFREIPAGVYPTIPLGAMLPAASHRLIAAGRCVSGDQESNSAYRVQASCMAMGQAAGAAAALAAERGVDFEELPMAELYDLLRRHDAIVPGDIGCNATQPAIIKRSTTQCHDKSSR